MSDKQYAGTRAAVHMRRLRPPHHVWQLVQAAQHARLEYQLYHEVSEQGVPLWFTMWCEGTVPFIAEFEGGYKGSGPTKKETARDKRKRKYGERMNIPILWFIKGTPVSVMAATLQRFKESRQCTLER